jgi:hypothetical protein
MFRYFATRAIKRAMTLGAVAVLAVACSDSSSSTAPHNDDGDPRGTYALRTVDGKALPREISRSPYFDADDYHFYNVFQVTVTKGEVALDELGNFTVSMDLAIVGDGVPMTKHLEVDGTYEIQGTQVVVTIDGASGVLPIVNGEMDVPIDLLGKGTQNVYAFRR